jgi:hypothetical protein
MKRDRLYKCLYDAGNGCTGEFNFWSDRRARSKANKEDARDEMKLRFNKCHEIIDIYLFEEGRA